MEIAEFGDTPEYLYPFNSPKHLLQFPFQREWAFLWIYNLHRNRQAVRPGKTRRIQLGFLDSDHCWIFCKFRTAYHSYQVYLGIFRQERFCLCREHPQELLQMDFLGWNLSHPFTFLHLPDNCWALP